MARLNTDYLILVVALLICFILSRKLQLALTQRRFAKSHDCKPVKKFPQRDPILGLDWFRAQLDAYKSHKFLEKATQRYEQQGTTFSGTTIGRVFLLTIDPENIRTLLASNFQDFGLGPRIAAMGPFLGSGIFTTDGKAWEHSRVSLCSWVLFLFRVQLDFSAFALLIFDPTQCISSGWFPFVRLGFM
jgi:hypothetical protein